MYPCLKDKLVSLDKIMELFTFLSKSIIWLTKMISLPWGWICTFFDKLLFTFNPRYISKTQNSSHNKSSIIEWKSMKKESNKRNPLQIWKVNSKAKRIMSKMKLVHGNEIHDSTTTMVKFIWGCMGVLIWNYLWLISFLEKR